MNFIGIKNRYNDMYKRYQIDYVNREENRIMKSNYNYGSGSNSRTYTVALYTIGYMSNRQLVDTVTFEATDQQVNSIRGLKYLAFSYFVRQHTNKIKVFKRNKYLGHPDWKNTEYYIKDVTNE